MASTTAAATAATTNSVNNSSSATSNATSNPNSDSISSSTTITTTTTTSSTTDAPTAMTPPITKPSGGSSPVSSVPSHQPLQATPVTTSMAMNGAVKAPKPRPLKLPSSVAPVSIHAPVAYGHHPNIMYASSHSQPSHQHHTESMSTDDLLELMESINRAVKASQFSPTLAGQIFRLYNQLKTCGEVLEQTHRNELNRVFVSLRQACCRDSGQLGTPCRLKMMELVELRAMGWRPNLAHSQYYLSRSTTNGIMPDIHTGDPMSGGELEQLGAAPVSAPPFGAMSINPFAFNIPAPMPSAADIVAANQAAMGPPAPSYYLIPATHVGHAPTGITFMAQSPAMMAPPPPAHHPVTATYSTPAVLSPMTMPNASPPIMFPKGAATKPSGKYSKPTKVPGKNQFRDEVVIRNADSGKIMGVKGRRVALIEEISKTVISFQKVPQGAKERMLTVTGPTEESIIQAKILIEDTIRRNVSPVRPEGHEGEIGVHADAENRSDVDPEDYQALHENGDLNTETEYAMAELGSILKLSCSDPAVLQAARQALSEYFHRHEPLRRSATDAAYIKQAHKERRKSMPLPVLANVAEVVEPENLASPKVAEDVMEFGDLANQNVISRQNKFNARSTPNLAAGERRNLRKMPSLRLSEESDGKAADNEHDSNAKLEIVYTRDFLLQCATAAIAKAPPLSMPTICEQMVEIVPAARESFDPVSYKQKCAEFKQVRY